MKLISDSISRVKIIVMPPEEMPVKIEIFNTCVHKIMNDSETSLVEKISRIADTYIEAFLSYPEVAAYMFAEQTSDPELLISKMKMVLDVNGSVMARQISDENIKNSKDIRPQHFIMNIISMCVFPFIAGNFIKRYGNLNDDMFISMMQERKKLIPKWTIAMIGS